MANISIKSMVLIVIESTLPTLKGKGRWITCSSVMIGITIGDASWKTGRGAKSLLGELKWNRSSQVPVK